MYLVKSCYLSQITISVAVTPCCSPGDIFLHQNEPECRVQIGCVHATKIRMGVVDIIGVGACRTAVQVQPAGWLGGWRRARHGRGVAAQEGRGSNVRLGEQALLGMASGTLDVLKT